MNRVSIRGLVPALLTATVAVLLVGATFASGDAPSSRSSHSPSTSTSTDPATAALAGPTRPFLNRARIVEAAELAAVRADEAKARAQSARDKAARDAAARARASRAVTRSVPRGTARQIGQQLAAARGWSGTQWTCLDRLWTRESGWSASAHNPSSGAHGIPQANPGSQMASAGSAWRTDATTQIRWGLGYIADRYGSPCSAYGYWQSHSWY